MVAEGPDKGGGYHGPPRRWTGNGPRPARHIPWPELFKHHQSVLTGHLKMMDMVRKHCAEGTGNYDTANACVQRTQEMLRMFKRAIATFVPPRDNLDKVPLGASSASMYPGYSPADHIYGEAADEYGQQVAEAKRKGISLESNAAGVEYVIGQSKLSAKEQLEEIKKRRKIETAKSREENPPSVSNENIQTQGCSVESVEQDGDASQLFMIDSNPTPVDVLQGKTDATSGSKGKNKANDKAKRSVSVQDEPVDTSAKSIPTDSHKKKKAKVASDEPAEVNLPTPAIEEDDITGEVDARHKIKEEKRQKTRKAEKEGKKRKRESDVSQPTDKVDVAATESTNVANVERKAEKPKKKKQKRTTNSVGAVGDELSAGKSAERLEPKKEKSKKRDIPHVEADASGDVVDGEERRKKRKKKAAD